MTYFILTWNNEETRAQDILGRVYDYFLSKSGSSEEEFYTPPTIVKLLVRMIDPTKEGFMILCVIPGTLL